jgi:2-polyprenyl-6-hydroxyphenyl methylase/3-demethylubiquinone-9 3-methyltransferase
MKKAIQNASVLVTRGGYLVLAIYNRHFSSRIWLGIKWSYNKAPVWLKNVMVATLFPIIWVAKLIATGKNPLAQARGMNFYYNVIDWVGGYPYEYANRDEVVHLVEPLGFRCIRFFPAKVPTGCNEFIFRRVS